ncbi:MAG: Gfo/Idh/MocA family oxidoreductase, partial [Chloroflexota bacterium]|nr:Gfo/Idh/MocA family oxidoreductase [Chloroflexota bacterium]
MPASKHKVAMIGVGRMGTNHARGYELHPRCELVAAADPDRRNLDRFRERFGVTSLYESYKDMLANEEIDIAAPVLPVRAN